jgi:hypothetical protein
MKPSQVLHYILPQQHYFAFHYDIHQAKPCNLLHYTVSTQHSVLYVNFICNQEVTCMYVTWVKFMYSTDNYLVTVQCGKFQSHYTV